MNTLKGQEELDQYKLTKREVADFLGITTNAVRMSMRGNNCHKLEYRYDGHQYLFKIPRRDTVITRNRDPLVQHNGTPKSTPRSTPGLHKKIYNRGATHRGEANYTSLALKMSNEARTMKAIDNKFVDEAHKLANEKDSRSVTTYTSIEKTIKKYGNIKLYFSSPNVSNPHG